MTARSTTLAKIEDARTLDALNDLMLGLRDLRDRYGITVTLSQREKDAFARRKAELAKAIAEKAR